MKCFRLWLVIFAWMSLAVSADCRAQEPGQPERPMTRKERREERKRLKNTPLALPELSRDGYRVSGGHRMKSDSLSSHVSDSLAAEHESLSNLLQPDSLTLAKLRDSTILRQLDSLVLIGVLPADYTIADSLSYPSLLEMPRPVDGYPELEEKYTQTMRDSTLYITDSVGGVERMIMSGTIMEPDSAALAQMSARERRQLRRQQMRADTTLYRHNKIFKDTIPISRMMWISLVAPGFGQFYNGDYWKIPALYATVGTTLYFGIRQHKQYVKYRDDYNFYLNIDPNRREYVAEMDALQTRMIQHNTWRQLLFAGAIGSYLYFLGDATMNYPSKDLSVKRATTLSTIFPGAGQFYNRSYWRAPIFVGGIAAMLYVIDWNDRIYQRYRSAYRVMNDDDPETNPPRGLPTDANAIKDTRDSARRNRDMCIILTGLIYFINIMDAHVDAHLKDYDISDDLAFRLRLEPSLNTINTQTMGTTSAFGFNLSYTF